MIGAGAALSIVAVILVALLTGGGKSGAHTRLCTGCSAAITSPSPGGAYSIDQVVTTSFSCRAPALIGCDDSTGTRTAAGGQGHLNTSTPGPHTYAVTTVSRGGATKVTTVAYTVVAQLGATIGTSVALIAHRQTTISIACSGGGPGAMCSGTVFLEIFRRSGRGILRYQVASTPFAAASGVQTSVALRLPGGLVRAIRRSRSHVRRAQVIVTTSGRAVATATIKLRT